MQQSWNGAVDFYGSPASVPLAVRVAVAQGVNIDFSQGEPAIRIDCGPYGVGCRFQVMWNGPVDTAGGEQAAIDLVAKAEEDIRRLQPEYAALFVKFRTGHITPEERARYGAVEAELQEAYFSYHLCFDDVGAPLLSSVVGQVAGHNLQRTKWLVADAQGRVAGVDIKYGGVETADWVFDVGLGVGSGVTIAGKFVVVIGVKVLRTAAGLVVPKWAADYLKAKGVTIWNGVGNLFGRTATNSGPRFITDSAGNSIDLNFTKGLTEANVTVTGSRGGVQYPLQGRAPNSYANLGNGHAVVYGPDGRALYDVSGARIKVVEWNQSPSGQWFPKKGSDTKMFEGNVPQSVLDDLGLN